MRKLTKEKICFKLGKAYSDWIESIWFRNWFNPLLTLYLNFRSFPLKQAFKFPVFIYGWPKFFSLYGKMECLESCKIGMVKINQTDTGAPSNPSLNTAINNWGTIFFEGPCRIYSANNINVARGAVLKFGRYCKIMHYCNITAHKYVEIGSQTWVAHRCQILDTNFHFIANFVEKKITKYAKPIVVGKSCWICNSSTILAGTVIPNNTIVASHSLVNKDFSDVPEESIVGGIPAKLISTGFKRVNNSRLNMKIWQYFSDHPEVSSYPLDDDFDHNECDSDEF
jgi:acetyltransferase-like isoleucine patch superfamily enzyme